MNKESATQNKKDTIKEMNTVSKELFHELLNHIFKMK